MKRHKKLYLFLLIIFVFTILISANRKSILKMFFKKDVSQEASTQIFKRLGNDINSDWAIEAIKCNIEKKNLSGDVKVAVIDTGINLKSSNIIQGINVIDGTNNIEDATGHGTDVSSIILKVNPTAKIIPIKVVGDSDLANINDVITAIKYAVNNGADVINISLGISEGNKEFDELLNECFEKNIAVVSSAGNTGGELMYPAKKDNVFSVIARDINNVDVQFSNKSIKKSYSAPGVHIKVADNKYVSGTSFSCSYLSGAISIIKQADKEKSVQEINKLLQLSSVLPTKYSYGLIQLDKLNVLLNK